MKRSAFEYLGTPTSFGIDTTKIDAIFQNLMQKPDICEDLKIQITKSYSTLRNNILRGEEILRIFEIQQELIEIPGEFFEELMDLSYEELTNLSDEIYDEMVKMNISSGNIAEFSNLFIRYKYINKAFLPK
jgi:hypothetical protein